MNEEQRSTSIAVAALGASALAFLVSGLQAQAITPFTLPPNYGGAESIVAGPDAALWFTLSPGTLDNGTVVDPGAIGRITTDGVFSRFLLPDARNIPGSIVAGQDGNLWFTEFLSDGSGRISKISIDGVITEFPSPTALSLTAGRDGDLWFIESSGFGTPAAKIGHMSPDGVLLAEIQVPSDRLRGIAAGPDGAVWFTESGSPATKPGTPPPFAHGCAKSRIGRIATGGDVEEFELPSCDGQPLEGITAGPDGNLWFTEFGGPGIGRINPASHVFTEFTLPVTSQPTAITAGPDGNLWFLAVGRSQIGRITPAGVITEFAPGSYVLGGGIAAGPNGTVWFSAPKDSKIGRITTGGCGRGSNGLCLAGGRFQATATYRNPFNSGEAAPISVPDGSGFFTFDNPDSVELAVKVLDACRIGSGFWVYAAGLTDQETTLTVIDTKTGLERTYFNPLGTKFVTVTDTGAFSTCP